MNWVIETIGGGIVVPAAVSLAVFFLVRLILSPETGHRYSAAVAFAAAYVVGYLLLPSWAKLAPDRHWHWTFYLAMVAAAVGAIAASDGLAVFERWLLTFLVALVSAWLLVPAWPNLEPSRTVWVSILTSYFFVLTALLEPLARRTPAATYIGAQVMTSACVSLLVVAYVSITQGQLAGIAAGGLVGCWAACLVLWQRSAPGLGLAYSVIVGGLAFIGCVEPRQPFIGLLVAPCAPLALWCGALPALQRLGATARAVFQIALVVAVLGMATVMVVVAGS